MPNWQGRGGEHCESLPGLTGSGWLPRGTNASILNKYAHPITTCMSKLTLPWPKNTCPPHITWPHFTSVSETPPICSLESECAHRCPGHLVQTQAVIRSLG